LRHRFETQIDADVWRLQARNFYAVGFAAAPNHFALLAAWDDPE